MTWRGGMWGGAARGKATKKAKANARWDRVVFYSRNNLSRDQAATELGIKIDTFNRLLKQHTGRRDWPVSTEHHPRCVTM